MLDRSLLTLESTPRGPRARFTEAGLTALRQLLLDRRAMDPERFGHLRRELGPTDGSAQEGPAEAWPSRTTPVA